MFDVVVVGAGPAGSVAATVLARGGARVLLLDRARFPRDKLCGDTINPGALAILRRLGLLVAIEPRARRVAGMVVTGERGVRVQCLYGAGEGGLAIRRRDLDAALANGAVAAGARFEDGVLVRGPLVESDGVSRRVRGVILAGADGRDVRIPAPMVIAADGRRSRLAIPLGLARQPAHPRRWAIGAYYDGVADVTTLGEMHVRQGHYIGVASVPFGSGEDRIASSLTNVCLVTPRTSVMSNPGALLRDVVAADPFLGERFRDAHAIAPPLVIGPLALDARAAGMPGLLLAGDAAGFIDPMTGDGLRFAVRGGELAGAVALAALAGTVVRPYERLARARRREFAAKWRFNRSLRRIVDHAAMVDLAAAVARLAPWMLRRTIAFAGDVPR